MKKRLQKILDDPMASDADLDRIEREVGTIAAMRHPNCSPARFWRIAGDCPVEAFRAPIGSLMVLEDPLRYQDLVFDRLEGWISQFYSRADSPARACATHEISELYLKSIWPLFSAQGLLLGGKAGYWLQKVCAERKTLMTLSFSFSDAQGEFALHQAYLHEAGRQLKQELDCTTKHPLLDLLYPFVEGSCWVAGTTLLAQHRIKEELDSPSWFVTVWQRLLDVPGLL